MNRKEWYESYSSYRLLFNLTYSSKPVKGSKEEYTKAFLTILNMIGIESPEHYKCLIEKQNGCIYPLRQNKWAIKHNSRQFNRSI